MLGQIDTASPAVGAAAELYILSTSYGSSVGTDVPLTVETQDVAPAGPTGVAILRRIEVPLEYDAACTVTVTPIVDFNQVLTATSKSYSSPPSRQRDVMDAPLSKMGTAIRAIITVTSRNGVVSVNTPSILSQPKTAGAAAPVGGTS